ncbi:DUF2274 domain-containing protein [Paracoccus kondratievae]|uniref:DUF2274 domain-containing protein n=1 Tax=Paracoccus kondratievae TaxID=135740 RepID=UPI0022F24B5B|nr:DUF2274 domain-containing protein [Paracoccus kondratievae]
MKVTAAQPAQLHRDLIDYGALFADGGPPIELARLIVPMLERFIPRPIASAQSETPRRPRSPSRTSCGRPRRPASPQLPP